METSQDSVSTTDRQYCERMLPKVSRTFAICIRLLPAQLEHPVLIAYLLCRIADTIEDTTSLTGDDKKNLLAQFAHCLAIGGADTAPLRDAFRNPSNDDERLTKDVKVVLREFCRLPTQQQTAIRPWVVEMCNGMAEFVESERGHSPDTVTSISTVEDLDRYCYYVAGTVGHMLTDVFAQHHPAISETRHARMRSLATSFGLGLQLTNIIKDVADDRRRGHYYVPRQLCMMAGIEPRNVRDGSHREESMEVLRALIEKAKGHLCDALEYSIILPRRQHGMRSFCLTSLFFAVKTLRLAERDTDLLTSDQKLKISRAAVVRTLVVTWSIASINTLVKMYFRLLAGGPWWRRCRKVQE